MATVLPFVLAAASLLAPDRDHSELGGAIARVIDAAAPLFVDDIEKRKTAALVIAVAFRESSLRLNVVGDHGRSFCAMQIHETSGGTRALLTDADACVRLGVTMLRTSGRVCASHPLAIYAEGRGGCSSPRAQRISRDRMALARRLVLEVKS